MKTMVRRLMLSAAFVTGLAVPLAATWSAPVQASDEACTTVSGRDQWTYKHATGASFTVNVAYDTGVTATGTPPPLGSLPLVLTSTSGHSLTISQSGTLLQYDGTFTLETDEACFTVCPNLACDSYSSSYDCNQPSSNAMCIGNPNCATTSCTGSGGSCSGGTCVATHTFTARF